MDHVGNTFDSEHLEPNGDPGRQHRPVGEAMTCFALSVPSRTRLRAVRLLTRTVRMMIGARQRQRCTATRLGGRVQEPASWYSHAGSTNQFAALLGNGSIDKRCPFRKGHCTNETARSSVSVDTNTREFRRPFRLFTCAPGIRARRSPVREAGRRADGVRLYLPLSTFPNHSPEAVVGPTWRPATAASQTTTNPRSEFQRLSDRHNPFPSSYSISSSATYSR